MSEAEKWKRKYFRVRRIAARAARKLAEYDKEAAARIELQLRAETGKGGED